MIDFLEYSTSSFERTNCAIDASYRKMVPWNPRNNAAARAAGTCRFAYHIGCHCDARDAGCHDPCAHATSLYAYNCCIYSVEHRFGDERAWWEIFGWHHREEVGIRKKEPRGLGRKPCGYRMINLFQCRMKYFHQNYFLVFYEVVFGLYAGASVLREYVMMLSTHDNLPCPLSTSITGECKSLWDSL